MFTNKLALITGVSSGIGYSTMLALLEKNCRVIGIVSSELRRTEVLEKLSFKTFSDTGAVDLRVCDLASETAIDTLAKELKKEGLLPDFLILNAGVGVYGPHEELSTRELVRMTAVNFTAPLLLTNLFLRPLKERNGHILFVSSITAQKTNNTHGCAYGATKAGISSFAKSLFEEVRKYDVRVTVLSPDLTRTELYRNASFTASEADDASLSPKEVADYAVFALNARNGLNLTEITMQPQHHRLVKKPGNKSL